MGLLAPATGSRKEWALSGYAWGDFPVSENPEGVRILGRDRIATIGGRRYLELPDNGWELLLAWLVGPRHVARTPSTATHLVRRVHRNQRGEALHSAHEPRTVADEKLVDSFVNGYLGEAGVPPRPRGFVWYLQLPDDMQPEELRTEIHRRTEIRGSAAPEHVRLDMVDALNTLYREE